MIKDGPVLGPTISSRGLQPFNLLLLHSFRQENDEVEIVAKSFG